MSNLIVIIEDTPEPREVMSLLLENSGFDVVAAGDGIDGLTVIRNGRRPALVLCDIQMPRLDGYGVIAAIRNDPQLFDLSVVAVTAYASDQDRQRAMQAGFDGFMTKPIAVSQFAAQVTQYLKRPATHPHP
jgi:two-component system, cell cycle response regulator DivK